MDNYKKVKEGSDYGIPGSLRYELLKSQGKIPAEYIKEMEAKKQLDTSEYERPADLKSIPNLRQFPEQDPFAEEKVTAEAFNAKERSVDEMYEDRMAKIRQIAPKQEPMFPVDSEDADEANRLKEERRIQLNALNKIRGQ